MSQDHMLRTHAINVFAGRSHRGQSSFTAARHI